MIPYYTTPHIVRYTLNNLLLSSQPYWYNDDRNSSIIQNQEKIFIWYVHLYFTTAYTWVHMLSSPQLNPFHTLTLLLIPRWHPPLPWTVVRGTSPSSSDKVTPRSLSRRGWAQSNWPARLKWPAVCQGERGSGQTPDTATGPTSSERIFVHMCVCVWDKNVTLDDVC
jgi:hypothetical protein